MLEKGFFSAIASAFPFIILLGTSAFPSDSARDGFHTTPDKWKEARTYHGPFYQRYEARLELGHSDLGSATGERTMSPNRAYWFVLAERDRMRSGDANLYIYNERDSLVRLLIKDYRSVEANWINEKLLYIEIWWGRVLGTYLILDVEQEKIVTREMVHDGGIAFMQWQQARGENNRRDSGEADAGHKQSPSREREN
jgi:hypothetical protein